MPQLSHPSEGVNVHSTGLFVPRAEVHWSCDQKQVGDAVLVNIQPTHLAAIVGPNLQLGEEKCSFGALPVGGALVLIVFVFLHKHRKLLKIRRNRLKKERLPVLH